MDAEGVKDMVIELLASGVTASVLDVLEAQGLNVRRKLDIDVPPFPIDITAVDDQELMRLARCYMENYNFLITQVACAELAVTESENAYDKAEANLLITGSSDPKMKATAVKASILVDKDMQDMSGALMKAKAYHKLLKTMQDNLERYYQLTSRELTRRTSSIKRF
jgi:hypothetical protein